MAYITINGADLYYETFGKPDSNKVPIVLIHGSTGTGSSNWSEVAPLLARRHFVIVPDCRGHGKSSNPEHSYSFKEMAADTAGLIQALGFKRAHIIGHSNGGNVALVILLEHPYVVQTAVPQAANAWVSPDLIEKEPPLFDPDRVEREAPGWMNEMKELHQETHGPNYWRDLLLMTVEELIREPNYTPEELKKVERPTLVIQGENDRVNAPFKHAQFISRWIPDSELWIPEKIGHSVHEEILFEWIEKVQDFLERRGDDDNDCLYRLSQSRFRDKRSSIFNVRAEPRSQQDQEGLAVSGTVLTAGQRQAVLDRLEGKVIHDNIQVLLTESTPWALVQRPVSDLLREAGRGSERVSQALVGEAVRILEDAGEWVRVQTVSDGYLGWIKASALHRREQIEVENYQKSCTHLVCSQTAAAFLDLENCKQISKLPFGVKLPVIEQKDGKALAQMPGGNCWWVAEEELLPLARRPRPDVAGVQFTLQYFLHFIGVPYLWGGRTPFGFDCSGLAYTFWHFMGVQLPRDADQQSLRGSPAVEPFLPGDLLFFGEPGADLLPGEPGSAERRISHVAISLGGREVIHASSTPEQVSINSLDPDSPLYSPWLEEHLAQVQRFI